LSPITDPFFYAVAIPAVLLAGIGKAGLGSLGLVVVPLMSLAVAPQQAAAVTLPILIAMDMIGLWAWRGRADWAVLRTVVPGAVLGIVIGALAFSLLDARWIKGILGVECVLFVLHRIHARAAIAAQAPRPPDWGRGSFWGAMSGFTSTIAHAGNPPLMQYLLPLKLDKERLVATSVLYFTAVNAVKLVPYGMMGLLDADNLGTALVLSPVIPVGYWLGVRLVKRLPEPVFHRVLLAMLLVTGVKLCWDAVFGG
jgi:uncharacterized protein